MSDEALVDRLRTSPSDEFGDFETLMGRHQRQVVANCRYLTRSPAVAEDLAQEVFVKAYFALARFEQRAAFGTWLRTIKVRHCLDYLRRERGRTFVDIEEPGLASELSSSATVDDELDTQQDRHRIVTVLDSLPDSLRVPLVLRDMDGLSYQEIADGLSLGLSATKMRIRRGRLEFRRRWGPRST